MFHKNKEQQYKEQRYVEKQLINEIHYIHAKTVKQPKSLKMSDMILTTQQMRDALEDNRLDR